MNRARCIICDTEFIIYEEPIEDHCEDCRASIQKALIAFEEDKDVDNIIEEGDIEDEL